MTEDRTLVITPDGRTFAILIDEHTDLRDMEIKYRYDLVEYRGTGAGVSTSKARYDERNDALSDGLLHIVNRIRQEQSR